MPNDGRITIEAEYFRYLTTLSSGAIIVLKVFVEKLFDNPIWKCTVVAAFLAFLLSAIASAAAYTVIVMSQEPLSSTFALLSAEASMKRLAYLMAVSAS
jgi:hypothetical protein